MKGDLFLAPLGFALIIFLKWKKGRKDTNIQKNTKKKKNKLKKEEELYKYLIDREKAGLFLFRVIVLFLEGYFSKNNWLQILL